MKLEEGYYWVVEPLVLNETVVDVGLVVYLAKPPRGKWIVRAGKALYRVGFINPSSIRKICGKPKRV